MTYGYNSGTLPRLAAVVVWSLAAIPGQGAGERLLVRDQVLANGPDVLVEDLVAGGVKFPEAWNGRVVMSAPAPGESRACTLASVAYALQRYDDMRDVALQGPLRLAVRRAGVPLAAAQIREAVVCYAKELAPWRQHAISVEIDPLDQPVLVSSTNADLRVTGHAAEPGGDLRFAVIARVNGVEERAFSVRAAVGVCEDVWVAAQAMDRGHIVTAEDLKPLALHGRRARSSYLPVTESIVGLELSRQIRPEEPLCRHYLRQPVCAESGDWLSVTSAQGALKVALRAKALARGRRGERVLCANESSSRRLLVRLTGPNQAVLDAAPSAPETQAE